MKIGYIFLVRKLKVSGSTNKKGFLREKGIFPLSPWCFQHRKRGTALAQRGTRPMLGHGCSGSWVGNRGFPPLIILILGVLLSSVNVLSDTLYLKNGGTIEGIVEEDGDYYVVNLGYGTASFPKSTVSEVKYSSGEEREAIKEGWTKEKPKPSPSKTPEVVTGQKRASEQPRHLEIGKQGERVDITNYVVKGKITIFDFYSPYCGPCMRVAPRLERLVQTRDDIVVRKININRPSAQGIDWDSPVVKQYNIKYVPYFKIYNEHGSLWMEGESASDKVYSWLE